MRFQAITQIILIGLALVMIFMIIRPMFAEIRTEQDQIHKYQRAVNTAGQFNARLNQLRSQAASFSEAEMEALNTYVPASVDVLSVSRDIVEIVERNDLIVQSVSVEDSEESNAPGGEEAIATEPVVPTDPTTDPSLDPAFDPDMMAGGSLETEADRALIAREFTVEMLGTYEQMKQMLADFERNEYPLRLVEFEFMTDTESQLFSYTVVLETYALNFE